LSSTNLKKLCKSLRLAYVAEIYESIPFDNAAQYLEDLFKKEMELREKAKAERLIKKARFLTKKDLDSYQWGEHIHFPPHTDRNDLCELNFISRRENVI
jgi:hypothetical protein